MQKWACKESQRVVLAVKSGDGSTEGLGRRLAAVGAAMVVGSLGTTGCAWSETLTCALACPSEQVVEYNALPLALNEERALGGVRALSEDAERTARTWEEPPDPVLGATVAAAPPARWGAYHRAMERHPWATTTLTGVAGTVLGDGLAQALALRRAAGSCSPSPAVGPGTQAGGRHGEGASRAEGGGRSAPGGGGGCSAGPGGAAGCAARGEPACGEGAQAGVAYDALRCARLVAFGILIGTPLSHHWYQFLDQVVFPSSPASSVAIAAKVFLDQALMTPIGMVLFYIFIKLCEGQPHQVVPTLRSKLKPSLLANWTVWPAAQTINFALVPLDDRILFVNIISIAWTAYISHLANSTSAPRRTTAPSAEAAEAPGPVASPMPLAPLGTGTAPWLPSGRRQRPAFAGNATPYPVAGANHRSPLRRA